MSRKKLPAGIKKVSTAFCISKESNEFLNKITHNKSKFVEELIKKYMENNGK